MEQQLPWAQLPQTVLSLLAPQVPSVVTAPVAADAADEVTALMTGSEEAAPLVAATLDAAELDGALVVEAVRVPEEAPMTVSVHPDWHPFETRQCSAVVPQYLHLRSAKYTSDLSPKQHTHRNCSNHRKLRLRHRWLLRTHYHIYHRCGER